MKLYYKCSKMKQEEKIKFELERQNFLFSYWQNAEKYELSIFGFIFGVLIIPLILNTSLSFDDWTTWGLIVVITWAIITSRLRLNHYNSKQKEIKEKVESLNI